jgi:formylglycine-generating enzyme required for sulfatase activity/serine/threonine protein kinase
MPEPTTEGSSASPNQSLPAGSRLEEFVIDRVLGVGGFGITYLARDQSLGRQVVIKENLPSQFCWRDTRALTVRPRHAEGEDAENFQYSLESFRKEATTLASLDHPGIVKVLRSFQAHGTAYFVMPFVEGTALDEVLRQRTEQRSPFTENEIRDLLTKVLDALAYLHDRGIYHRDIKPGNILMTTAGPVLIDFGAARQRLSERSLTVIESAGYTPFEQLQSRGKVGPWSDIYALGGTLYKAITGETAAKATDRAFDDPQVPLAQRSELRNRYSSRLLESIDQAMAPKASDRFQETAQWRDGLGPSKAATPLTHEPAATPPPVPVGHTSSGNSLHEEHERILAEAAAAIARNDARAAVALFEQLEGKRFVDLDYSQVIKYVLQREDRQTGLVALVVIFVLLVLCGWTGLTIRNVGIEKETTAAKTTRLVQENANTEALRIAQERVEAEEKQRQMTSQLERERVIEEEMKRQTDPNDFNTGEVGDTRVVTLGGGVQLTLCYCPPGSFTMGSPASEVDRSGDEDQVQVRISRGFWLAQTECTQAQWRAVMGTEPSNFKGDDLPVEQVSWEDAQAFMTQLNRKNVLPSGWKSKLPTEAQWEYACRAGTTVPYAGDLERMAWYGDNSGSKTHSVGTKATNAWGLYDLHGNVGEWCIDWYSDKLPGGNDPVGASSGSLRVLRGGAWGYGGRICRRAFRLRNVPGARDKDIGFRVASVPVEPEAR